MLWLSQTPDGINFSNRRDGPSYLAFILIGVLVLVTNHSFGMTDREALPMGGVSDVVAASASDSRIESDEEWPSIWNRMELGSASLQTDSSVDQDPILVPLPPPVIVTTVGLGVAWLLRRRMPSRSI